MNRSVSLYLLAIMLVMMPDVKEKLEAIGLTVVAESAGQFAQVLKSDYEKYGKLIRRSTSSLNDKKEHHAWRLTLTNAQKSVTACASPGTSRLRWTTASWCAPTCTVRWRRAADRSY